MVFPHYRLTENRWRTVLTRMEALRSTLDNSGRAAPNCSSPMTASRTFILRGLQTGQRIAYYAKNRGGIWLMSALGGTPKQLTEFGARPAWSSDGSMIAFQSGAPGEIFSAHALQPSTIWIVPSQGGAPKTNQSIRESIGRAQLSILVTGREANCFRKY